MIERQMGLNIKETIDVILSEFGCAHDKNLIVTDNAKNMISACDDKERYSCSRHNINLVLKNTLKNNDKEIVKIN
jgi:hypothetical protein